jgi:hypothetical protein
MTLTLIGLSCHPITVQRWARGIATGVLRLLEPVLRRYGPILFRDPTGLRSPAATRRDSWPGLNEG